MTNEIKKDCERKAKEIVRKYLDETHKGYARFNLTNEIAEEIYLNRSKSLQKCNGDIRKLSDKLGLKFGLDGAEGNDLYDAFLSIYQSRYQDGLKRAKDIVDDKDINDGTCFKCCEILSKSFQREIDGKKKDE